MIILTFVFRSQKDSLKQQEQQEEQRMIRNHKDYLDLEVRKFRRRKLLAYHQLEQDLLREVNPSRKALCNKNADFFKVSHQLIEKLDCRSLTSVSNNWSKPTTFFWSSMRWRKSLNTVSSEQSINWGKTRWRSCTKQSWTTSTSTWRGQKRSWRRSMHWSWNSSQKVSSRRRFKSGSNFGTLVRYRLYK